MKECFVPKTFNSKSKNLLLHIEEILTRYAVMGYDLSVRQLYYQLVAQNIIKNNINSYKSIVSLVSEARLAGVLDWSSIIDRNRQALRDGHFKNISSGLNTLAASYTIDKWSDQPYYIEVFVEKQALEGILYPICQELDVTFTANKGYSSASSFYRAGKRFRSRAADGKKLVVLYLGDHDPSGIDMTRDIADRIRLLGGLPWTQRAEGWYPPENLDIEVVRLALNFDQVQQFNPPKNFAKETDSRHSAYKREFGEDCWELDAVDPLSLVELVRANVIKFRDEVLWTEALKRESLDVAKLERIAKRNEPKKNKRK